MTSLDTLLAGARPKAQRAALPVFAGALFLSALLLFAVQPMFTKMALPVLGSSPAVWSVALVFFQAVLLAGYAYAHVLTRHLPPRAALAVHLGVLALAFATLPIALTSLLGRPPAEGQLGWTFALYALSVGLPFFAVSGNAPLLQAWFARTADPHARDPYFLYGASNLGSFAALMLYPVAIEPLLSLSAQARAWQAGFAVLAVLIVAAGLVAGAGSAPAATDRREAARAVSWRDRLGWAGFAFVPSALLVAVTAHISTDLAAAPFLWVVPLALFLLTFVLAFRDPPLLSHALMLRWQAVLVAAIAPTVLGIGLALPFLLGLAMTLAVFFLCAMVAHGELFRRRPAAADLTAFYLWMSAGGVAGGVFASLAAPHLFATVLEYPILLVAALLCRPGAWSEPARERAIAAAIVAVALVATLPGQLGWVVVPKQAMIPLAIAAFVLSGLAMLSRARPWRLVAIVAAIFLVTGSYQPGTGRSETTRSFFGVHKVIDAEDGSHRALYHGTTLHGVERLRDADGRPVTGRPEPLSYYYVGGPISQGIDAARQAGAPARVAAVGLGTGSLACHRRPGEQWTFFEIDAEVVRIARDPARFRFLEACGSGVDVVLGDARLTLAEVPATFDVIVLDAFSSDAIPVHLLTREAMALYLARLAPGGVLVFHLSNRHMALGEPVARTAAELGLVTRLRYDSEAATSGDKLRANSIAAAIARSGDDLQALTEARGWRPLAPDMASPPWTDDYANLIGAIWRQYRR